MTRRSNPVPGGAANRSAAKGGSGRRTDVVASDVIRRTPPTRDELAMLQAGLMSRN